MGQGPNKQEFVKKVKEIERRIIQHLHQRGYDESHPDYHRYLAKAKELAIQKAGKEREKMLAARRNAAQGQGGAAGGQGGNNPFAVDPQEYDKMVRYRAQQQKQHEEDERQRRLRMAQEKEARHKVCVTVSAYSLVNVICVSFL